MSGEHFRLLFAYNRWANERVLAQVQQVPTEDYFALADGLSFGSLHATLVHILVGEIVWFARWQGGLPPENLKDARKADQIAAGEIADFESLLALWHSEWPKQEAFAAALDDDDINRPLSYQTQYGEPNTQPLGQLVAHLVNHGTQFRAEAAVRLTQLGQSPGDLDLIVYIRGMKP
jgi:uncharacterized damage-inducible protein DinB